MTPIEKALARVGYVRRDDAADQTTAVRPGSDQPPATDYPQVVMVRGRSVGESWVRDHAGQLLLAAGVGVFGLTALAVVALVAILVTVAMVVCSIALLSAVAIVGAATASHAHSPGRGRRWGR